MADALFTFTIYVHPRDFPDKYVVRRWRISPASPEPVPDALPWAVEDSLEQARASLPMGLVSIGRELEDEPHIVETWI